MRRVSVTARKKSWVRMFVLFVEYSRSFIAYIIKQVAKESSFEIFSNPGYWRHFVHFA